MIRKVIINDYLVGDELIEIINSIFYAIESEEFWISINYLNGYSELFLLTTSNKGAYYFMKKNSFNLLEAVNIVTKGAIKSIEARDIS